MKGLKFLVGLGFILSLASLGGNWFLYQRLQVALDRHASLESDMVQLEEQNAELESQAAKADQYGEELERLREQMKAYIEQRDQAKREVEEVRKEAAELRKQIRALESEKGLLTEQVTLDEEAERAISQEAVKISKPASPLTAEPPPATKQEVQGKIQKKEEDPWPFQVLSINRQFNFVVVNLGIRDRLKIGDELRVEQNGKLIGRIKVEKLYENFSACGIVEETSGSKIKEGDLVRVA